MRYSYASFGMILVGLFGFAVVMVFQFITIGNESDYYSLKEAMEASMYESIDVAYYIEKGEMKIIQEKFVSNFTRRFLKNTTGNATGYVLEFYDIMETPPKASVMIKAGESSMGLSIDEFKVVNKLSGLIEADNVVYETLDDICDGEYKYDSLIQEYYSFLGLSKNNVNNTYYVLKPPSLAVKTKTLYVSKIEFVDFVSSVTTNQGVNFEYYRTNKNGNLNKVNSALKTYNATCENKYLSFSAASVKSLDGYNGENDDFIRVSVVSDKPGLKSCNAIAHYKITWKYGYCK